MMTMDQRVKRYEKMRKQGRLLRRAWTNTVDGREHACWLAALSPEVAAHRDVKACPANVMPKWMTHMTPELDDNVSDASWDAFAARYGKCASVWSRIDDAGWGRIKLAVILEALSIAKTAVESVDTAYGIERIAEVERLLLEGGDLFDLQKAGKDADDCSLDTTLLAMEAEELSWARETGSSRELRAVSQAHEAARFAAHRVVDSAARHAAHAFRLSAGADSYTGAPAWDRIATVLFDAIEKEAA